MQNLAPNFNFQNIQASTERCLRLLGKNADNSNLVESIQELLLYSAGYLLEVPYYRPYYVAAIHLSQDIQANKLSKAGDAEFRSTENIIQSFISTQNSLDLSLGLVIPLGFSTGDFLAGGGSSAPLRRVYGSSSASANFTF